jgi:hypothetical protein
MKTLKRMSYEEAEAVTRGKHEAAWDLLQVQKKRRERKLKRRKIIEAKLESTLEELLKHLKEVRRIEVHTGDPMIWLHQKKLEEHLKKCYAEEAELVKKIEWWKLHDRLK